MTNKRKEAKKKDASSPIKKSKIEKRQENYGRVALQLITSKQYRPLSLHELAEKLTIIEEHVPDFEKALAELNDTKKIEIKQGLYHATAAATTIPTSKKIGPSGKPRSRRNLSKNGARG